jgi:hypothetical protein
MAGSKFGFAVPRGPWLFDFLSSEREGYDMSDYAPATADELAKVLDAFDEGFRSNPQGWLK